MAKITVSEPFDYSPRPNVVLAYKPGTYTVKRECADHAVAAGKAVEIKAHRRRKAPE